MRNVSLTAPYFHNGSVQELKEAIRVMAVVQLNKTISNNPLDDKHYYWSVTEKKIRIIDNTALSEQDINDIAAFLESLAGHINNVSTASF